MQVKDVMTQDCDYVSPNATLKEAAQEMLDRDIGFLPIGNPEKDKLEGVLTDRDIVIRAIAQGLDPSTTRVSEIETNKVLYCCQDDDLEYAADSMREQHVYRLVVVSDRENKRLCGVISLGDIHRHHQNQMAAEAAEGITQASSSVH